MKTKIAFLFIIIFLISTSLFGIERRAEIIGSRVIMHPVADGDSGNAVVGFASFEAEQPLAPSERKPDDVHVAKLGREEMSKLMHEYKDTKQDDEAPCADQEIEN